MKLIHQSHHTPASSGTTTTLRPLNRKWVSVLVAGLSLHCAVGVAQTLAITESSAHRSGGYIGIGVNVEPRYQGSDETRTRAIPGFEYHWMSGWFVGGANGLAGVQINPGSKLQLGLALGVDEGRKASRSPSLASMGDIDVRGTLNLFAKAAITDDLSLSASVRMGAGNSKKGALLNLGASYGFQLSPTLRMNLNAGATAANSHYMQEYFGINAEQAIATRYKRYNPGSGCRDVTVGLSVIQQVSREWVLIASLNSTTLANEAKDSPLVRNASGNSAYASLAYSF